MTAPATRAKSVGSSFTGLLISCALLFAALGPASVITAAVLEGGISWRAMSIAAAAGSVCYVAAAMSLVVTFAGNQLGMPVQGLLLGMLFRMGLPLAAIIVFGTQRALGATIVVVYLLALVVETILSVRMTPAKPSMSKTDTATMASSRPRPSAAS